MQANPTDNLIVHGDNLEALKALLPRYAGKVNCIYIDPPYNTGNEGWTYNDNVNSPLMREWLAKNNPIDGEDMERHDKWLCMMWPRLQLMKDLLASEGVIFVSIDDNEQHRLRMLMDDIFGFENFVATIIWKKRSGAPNDKRLGATHEFIMVYTVNGNLDSTLNRRERTADNTSRYRNPDNHSKGAWTAGDLMANVKGGRYVESLHFPIINPNTGQEHYPGSDGNWRFNRETINALLENDEIYFGTDGKGRPKLKRFLADVKAGVPYATIWDDVPIGTRGTREMQELFGTVNAFDTAKPEGLIGQILTMATRSDGIVLDSFAGSGTTAHATLALNKKDGGNRKFILIECEDYADTITAERVRRVINGLPEAKDEALREGLGGSFTYCTLGEPIDAERMLSGETLPNYPDLAAHLLYTAKGITASGALRQPADGDPFYSDPATDTDYYLLYQSDPEWLRGNDAMLSYEQASHIAHRGRAAVVFAAGKYMGQGDLTRNNITFCQLPYDLHRSG